MAKVALREAPKYIRYVRNPETRYWDSIAKKLCDHLHWDNSYHDYDIWRRAFPAKDFALWVAIDERKDLPVVMCSTCNFRKTNNPGQAPLGMMSMFYMLPEYRGQNIGWNLFPRVRDECVENMLFYATDWMRDKYAEVYGVDKNPGWDCECYIAKCSDLNPTILPYDKELEVKDYGDINPSDMLQYDRKMTAGINRDNYLLSAIAHPDQVCKVTTDENGKMTGICRVREIYGKTLSFGPFYADTPLIASTLLRAALFALPPTYPRDYKLMMMKVPSNNEAAQKLVKDLMDGANHDLSIYHTRFSKEVLKFPTELIYSLTELNANII